MSEFTFPSVGASQERPLLSMGEALGAHVDRVMSDEIPNRPWFIHKMVKQALWRPLFAIAWGPRSLQMYRSYAARYSANPHEDIFHDPAVRIFDRKTRIGRAFERVMKPKEFRKTSLSEGERDSLRASGAKYGRFAATIMTRANYVRIGGNLIGLADNLWGQGGSAAEAVVMGIDTAISSSFIGVQTCYARGFRNIELARGITESASGAAAEAALAKQQRAYRLFKTGKIISYSAFGLQTAGAIVKLINELSKGSDARLSVLVDAGVDIGQGGAYSVYNYYLVRESIKVLKGAEVASNVASKTGFVKKATDVLSVSARVIPRPLLWAMRTLGIAGSILGVFPSVKSLSNGIKGDDLSWKKRLKMIVSGSLGVLSSAAFAIGAYYITPVGLTVGTIAILCGLATLGIQTVIDEWDNIELIARKGWNTCRWFVGSAVDNVVGIASSIPSLAMGFASNVIDTCANYMGRAISAVGGFFSTAWDWLFG